MASYAFCEACLSEMGLIFEDSATQELEKLVKHLGGDESTAKEIAKRLDPGECASCGLFGSGLWMKLMFVHDGDVPEQSRL